MGLQSFTEFAPWNLFVEFYMEYKQHLCHVETNIPCHIYEYHKK